ncbi:MAG: hypothetical protein CM15mP68_7810 [Pseudomonadota bacterium]|nr:MAG: hypothetical protein CM15mP68_7810 [Pseudomonadota bacterium]
MQTDVVVLAAGKGTRMHSKTAKVCTSLLANHSSSMFWKRRKHSIPVPWRL